MCLSQILLGAVLIGSAHPDATRVRHVEVVGNLRIPAVSILHLVSAAPDKLFDPAATRADLGRLHSMGIFQEVEVDSRDAGTGYVDVTYHVTEFPLVSAFTLEGINDALGEQIREMLRKEKLEILPASPLNPALANRTARAVRDFLRDRKHPNAEVRVVRQRTGATARVTLQINPGPRMEVGGVHFSGNKGIPEDELRKQMKHTRRASFWTRWGGAGRYVPEELTSDVELVRRYYQSRGFAAAAVGEPEVKATYVSDGIHLPIPGLYGSNPKLVVQIPVVEGPLFTLSSVEITGDPKAAAADVEEILKKVQAPALYDGLLLDHTRQKIADALGHHGYALARVELAQTIDPDRRSVSAVFNITAGNPVLVGRIEFEGNKRMPDKFLRRELKTVEGEVFDSSKLDASVLRLNKCNLVKEISRRDVALRMDEGRNVLDITFKVKEKDRQGIYGTGGTGGISGGYLGLIYTAFNLLRLGETLSFELDGGASQSNMLLNIAGSHFLGTPFSIALAGFNRFAGFNVANIVPGPENMIRVLSRRTAGGSLSGAYPLTTKLQAGLGFLAARDHITGEDQQSPAVPAGPVNRSDITPFLLYDSTTGIGPGARGYRVGVSHALSGNMFLRSLDSTSDSFQFAGYLGDPLSRGRNSFAFMVQGSSVRPHGGPPLFLDRRFFPGDESVRGFQGGGLSPWAYVPDNSTSPLQPAGADMMIGFASEYRVPLYGALSGVAFVDLGWTHVSPFEASQLGAGARLVKETNGLLRASVGGELRLQLPMVRQPARLIFAWNPLRLRETIRSPSSLLSLTDPRGAVRFALGNLF
ncbi:MAG TPA: POTRA domain-containing protein [Acidobacteriota bacterium]|nr:POTRA domain-containing protein [Acidobacteriota bacterium]